VVTGGVTIVTGDASWPERRFSLVVQLLLKVVVHNSVGRDEIGLGCCNRSGWCSEVELTLVEWLLLWLGW